MAVETKGIEELFLKIFKVAILVLMTLALLSMVGLMVNAAYQSSKSANPVAPAKKAPPREINMEDLKQYLLKQNPPASQPQSPAESRTEAPALLYLEDVTKLYRCSIDFANKVSADLSETNSNVIADRLRDLRQQVETLAAEKSHRGEKWVKAATTFTCAALADPSIIALRKEGRIKSAFFPILNFHLMAWDKIEADRVAFDQAEEARFEEETQAEKLRIALAKADALNSALAAGAAFAVFMVLALYLLGAKIETDLRDINRSIERLAPSGS